MNLKQMVVPLSGCFLLCLISFFGAAFNGLTTSPMHLLPITAAAVIASATIRDLAQSMVYIFGVHLFSIILAVLIVELPVYIMLGELSAELASLVVVRNVLLYELVLAAPLTLIVLIFAGYAAEKSFKWRLIVRKVSPVALLLVILVVHLYSDWWNEVYSVKTLSVDLIRVEYASTVDGTELKLRLRLVTKSSKALPLVYLRYFVYKGSQLIRQLADNYPEPLLVTSRGVEVSKGFFSPGVAPECFKSGSCRITLQVVVQTRFGLSFIDFSLPL